jgi:plasmid maintenance system antidote protein VapI
MTPSIEDKRTRNAVRVWMRKTLKETGMSAEDWARQAATSATNITRVLSPTSTITPNLATVARLARVVGTQPSLLIH